VIRPAPSSSLGPKPWQTYATGALACAALSAAAYFGWVQPIQERHDQQIAQRVELETRHRKAMALANALTGAKYEAAKARQAVAAMTLQVQPAAGINERLHRLATLARASGLSIDEMQQGAAFESTHFQVIPIRVAVTGTYPASAGFLHSLREKFPDTTVRSFESINTNPARESPTGTCRLELLWYTAKPDPDVHVASGAE
jgi:Tfp pilus assembly protein PilO